MTLTSLLAMLAGLVCSLDQTEQELIGTVGFQMFSGPKRDPFLLPTRTDQDGGSSESQILKVKASFCVLEKPIWMQASSSERALRRKLIDFWDFFLKYDWINKIYTVQFRL